MRTSVILFATALIALGLFGTEWQERLRRVTTQKEVPKETNNQRLPKTITVKLGESLQKAIDSARYGDEIIVEAGASFQGPIILRNKGPLPAGMTDDGAYITIRSSRLADLPPAGTRVSPQHAPLMPKVLSGSADQGALQTETSAHHYKIIGIEFLPAAADQFVYDLIILGRGGFAYGQNTLEEVPHHFIFDRCYIHAYPTQELKRGIALNSSDTEIINCYISDFKSRSQDSQAICGWNTPGNLRIENNYLEGSGENFMMGGSDIALQNVVPSNIVFRRNYVRKPPEWHGVWVVKNLFELKIGKNVLIEANIFENCWVSGQNGTGIVLKVQNQDGRAPWTTLEDVVFKNNIVRNVSAGVSLLGLDYLQNFNAGQAKRLRLENNLIIANNPWRDGGGQGIMLNPYVEDLQVIHNTIHSGNVVLQIEEGSPYQHSNWPNRNARLVFMNNIGTARGVASGPYAGTAALNYEATNWQYRGNVYADYYGAYDCDTQQTICYPVGNYNTGPNNILETIKFTDVAAGNYRLRPDSPFKGRAANKRDVGCNFDLLEEITRGVVQK